MCTTQRLRAHLPHVITPLKFIIDIFTLRIFALFVCHYTLVCVYMFTFPFYRAAVIFSLSLSLGARLSLFNLQVFCVIKLTPMLAVHTTRRAAIDLRALHICATTAHRERERE